MNEYAPYPSRETPAPMLSAETADWILAANIRTTSYTGPITRRKHSVALTVALALGAMALVVFGLMA